MVRWSLGWIEIWLDWNCDSKCRGEFFGGNEISEILGKIVDLSGYDDPFRNSVTVN